MLKRSLALLVVMISMAFLAIPSASASEGRVVGSEPSAVSSSALPPLPANTTRELLGTAKVTIQRAADMDCAAIVRESGLPAEQSALALEQCKIGVAEARANGTSEDPTVPQIAECTLEFYGQTTTILFVQRTTFLIVQLCPINDILPTSCATIGVAFPALPFTFAGAGPGVGLNCVVGTTMVSHRGTLEYAGLFFSFNGVFGTFGVYAGRYKP